MDCLPLSSTSFYLFLLPILSFLYIAKTIGVILLWMHSCNFVCGSILSALESINDTITKFILRKKVELYYSLSVLRKDI